MSSLMGSGLELKLIGMGTVFVFLTLLVFATSLMSSLVLKFAPAASAPSPALGGEDAAGPSAEEVAAITLALQKHRQQPPAN